MDVNSSKHNSGKSFSLNTPRYTNRPFSKNQKLVKTLFRSVFSPGSVARYFRCKLPGKGMELVTEHWETSSRGRPRHVNRIARDVQLQVRCMTG